VRRGLHSVDRLALAAASLRALRLSVANPAPGQSIKKQFDVPPEVLLHV
jgi:hypothetical protein